MACITRALNEKQALEKVGVLVDGYFARGAESRQ
jgi:hypothetical protein